MPTVKEGDAVTMGSVIGAIGDTSLAETGEVTHVHFSMTVNGESADPAAYLPKKSY
jgi:murein DD-endopeptidase MepM/ murein hydrolase activator NlpD